MLSRGMRDKPIQYRSGRGEGTAILKVRLSTEHCQSFFINATSKLMTKLQATRDWLIQHQTVVNIWKSYIWTADKDVNVKAIFFRS